MSTSLVNSVVHTGASAPLCPGLPRFSSCRMTR
jgi:hypothetical protein